MRQATFCPTLSITCSLSCYVVAVELLRHTYSQHAMQLAWALKFSGLRISDSNMKDANLLLRKAIDKAVAQPRLWKLFVVKTSSHPWGRPPHTWKLHQACDMYSTWDSVNPGIIKLSKNRKYYENGTSPLQTADRFVYPGSAMSIWIWIRSLFKKKKQAVDLPSQMGLFMVSHQHGEA